MKRLLFLLLTLMSAAGVAAQEQWGTWSLIPRVGLSVTSLSNNNIYITAETPMFDGVSKPKYTSGLTAGVDVMYQTSEMLTFSIGAAYTQAGCRYDFAEVENATHGSNMHDSYTRLHYIDVPVLAQVYLSKGFAVKVGVQPSFLVSAKTHGEVTEYDIEPASGVPLNVENTVYEYNPKDLMNKVVVSIPVGLSYEYAGFVIDGRYNIGLTKVFSHDLPDSKNKIFTLTFGYKFDL